MFTALFLIKLKVNVKVNVKVKVKVSLTRHGGTDTGWNVWHLPLL